MSANQDALSALVVLAGAMAVIVVLVLLVLGIGYAVNRQKRTTPRTPLRSRFKLPTLRLPKLSLPRWKIPNPFPSLHKGWKRMVTFIRDSWERATNSVDRRWERVKNNGKQAWDKSKKSATARWEHRKKQAWNKASGIIPPRNPNASRNQMTMKERVWIVVILVALTAALRLAFGKMTWELGFSKWWIFGTVAVLLALFFATWIAKRLDAKSGNKMEWPSNIGDWIIGLVLAAFVIFFLFSRILHVVPEEGPWAWVRFYLITGVLFALPLWLLTATTTNRWLKSLRYVAGLLFIAAFAIEGFQRLAQTRDAEAAPTETKEIDTRILRSGASEIKERIAEAKLRAWPDSSRIELVSRREWSEKIENFPAGGYHVGFGRRDPSDRSVYEASDCRGTTWIYVSGGPPHKLSDNLTCLRFRTLEGDSTRLFVTVTRE